MKILGFIFLALAARPTFAGVTAACANISGLYVCDEGTPSAARVKFTQDAESLGADDGRVKENYRFDRPLTVPAPDHKKISVRLSCSVAGVKLTGKLDSRDVYKMSVIKSPEGLKIRTVQAGQPARRSDCRKFN